MELGAMHKCAVFVLAAIACSISHLVFSVEGRQIKSASKNVDSAMHKEDDHHHLQPEAPSYILNASQKPVLPPPIPTKSSDFGDSVARFDDDFRPTTPGNSPGIGHSFAEDDEDVERKPGSISSTNDKHSIAADKEDFRRTSSDFGDSVARFDDGFRPTTPGNSPGIGHSFAEDDEDVERKPGSISSTNDEHSIAADKEDFRRTSPGHSPGVGHVFASKNSEPNA